MYEDQYKNIINLLDKIKANNIDFNIFFNKVNEELATIKNEDTIDNIILTILENNYEIICSTGFIRELKKAYPQSNITVILDKKIQSSLLINNPHIYNVIYVQLETDNLLDLIRNCIDVGKQLFWDKNISKAFTLSWPSSIAALFFNWLINAKERIGFGESIINIYNEFNTYNNSINNIKSNEDKSNENNSDVKSNNESDKNKLDEKYQFDKLLTNLIVHPKELTSDILRKYYILESLGFKVEDKSLELFIDKKEDNRKIICVDLSHSAPNWVFSIKKLIQFLSQIIDDDTYIMYKSNDLVNERYFQLLLTTNIYSNYEKLIDKDKLIPYDINLMQNIILYIGNNTENMHIASAYNKPIIVFFAEAEDKELNGLLSIYKRLRPYAWLDDPPAKILQPEYAIDNCVIHDNIGGCTMFYPHCINEITVEQIKDAFDELFPNGI